MSEEDEIRAVGRLALERSATKKQHALVRATLETIAENFDVIADACRNPDDRGKWAKAMAAIDRTVNADGIEDVQRAFQEHSKLSEKLRRLDERARETGID